MFEKLAKRSSPTSLMQPSPAVQTPKAECEVPVLRWTKPVADSSDGSVRITSECGRYQVERREIGGRKVYFAMTCGPEFRHELGRKTSGDEAKALCESAARARAARESVPADGS